ncbi:MAG: ArsA family ATPase [Rectinema sp.]|nr:ArsA family ATPase [Rectinema sp.]
MKDTAFFLGKGGVGKTTLSSAFAIELARRGKKVLIASLDPAHNLGDTLYIKLNGQPRAVEPNLDALEVDLSKWVERYLEDSRRQLKENYSYNLALNLDSFFSILKYSPGTEEYAVLWAIEDVHCRLAPHYDFVVFDTPPTALSLRFLSLPFISGLWVAELTKLRERILERRQTITRLNPTSPVAASCVDKDDDKVYGKLTNIRARLAALATLFSTQSFMSVIVNPDDLSIYEAMRIRDELDRLGLPLEALCVNKQGVSDATWQLAPELSTLPRFEFNFAREGIHSRDDLARIGMASLVQLFLEKGNKK